MVSVGLARMVEMVVCHEVDISDLKDIADGFSIAGLVKELDCLCLCIGEWWDDAFVREPLQRPDIVWVKPTEIVSFARSFFDCAEVTNLE